MTGTARGIRLRSLASLAAVAMVACVAFADAPSHARSADDVLPDPVEPFPLEIGPWQAVAWAGGTATASGEGITIDWTGEIPADFEFGVFDDGAAEGTWTHEGSAIMNISGSAQGVRLSAIGDLSFAGGGAIGGTNQELTLRGSSTTTGSVDVTVEGIGSRSMGVNNTSAVPNLSVKVSSTTCDEAYGEWVYTVEQAFEDEGFDASFDGYWWGFRNVDEIERNIGDLIASINGGGDGETQSELMLAAANLLREYNSLIDAQPWSLGQVLDLGERTEFILNIVRNLTECERRLYGEENVERFINGLTFIIQGLVIGFAGNPEPPSSSDFQHLVHLASRNGAMGPGAPNPAQAVAAEDGLISMGERILEANIDPEDGLIFVNDDTRRVMGVGASMDWTYFVNGSPYPAREVYQGTLGESWEPVPGADG